MDEKIKLKEKLLIKIKKWLGIKSPSGRY